MPKRVTFDVTRAYDLKVSFLVTDKDWAEVQELGRDDLYAELWAYGYTPDEDITDVLEENVFDFVFEEEN